MPTTMMTKKLKIGFTLIELLVVISIIGILIALSGFGLQGARKSARDARRKADIEQMRSALELYKSDCGDYPPNSSFGGGSSLTGDGTPSTTCPVTNVYMASRPDDPVSPQIYRYNQLTSTTYEICAALENSGGNVPCAGANPGICSGSGSIACNYRVTNP